MKLTRHFVTVGSRRVHYTRMGEGPAVCLLHSSPCSVKVLRQPQEVFAGRFTALAFDTPGFGLSDPLPLEQPEIEDFADALADTLTALGIEQTATYGRHTGASIAVEFAARHPARCALALADGYPVFPTPLAGDALANYLLPLQPHWDGSHLTWLWFRYRDQHVFWPWNRQVYASRADTDVPDIDFLQRGVVEMLESGDGYRVGYASAFRHRGLDILPDLKVPVCFGNRPGDSMFKTMSAYPRDAWIHEMPRDPLAAAAAERTILLRHPAHGAPPPAPPPTPIVNRSTPDYLDIAGRQVLVRTIGDIHAAAPLVIAPHVPGSSALYESLLQTLDVPSVIFDPPGHGESEPRPDATQSPETWAETLWAVCDALGVGSAHLMGHYSGAATAIAAAHARPARALSLILEGPIAVPRDNRAEWADRWAPDATPVWDGSHLVRLWHCRRDMALWFPWWNRDRAHAQQTDLPIDPEMLQDELREVAKNPLSFAPAWHAAIAWPLPERLALLPHRLTLLAGPHDLFAACLDAVRAVRPDAALRNHDGTPAHRAAAILAALTE